MPSFLHTHWLAAGLCWGIREHSLASRVLDYLATTLDARFADNQLSWMAVSLLAVKYPRNSQFVATALNLQETRQRPDGSWTSEDGREFDSHATYEALRAFKMGGRIRPTRPTSRCLHRDKDVFD